MSETETYPVQQVAARQKTMRAVALDRFGGPEVLRVQTIPVPEVGPDEILIEIEAAGVGPWDPSEREGELAQWSGIAPKFPYIPGSDGAGTVVAVGKEVRGFREGDSVYALSFVNPKGGFYAEYTAVKTDGASLIPGDLTIEQAGAMPVDAITALRGLDDLLNLQAGESVLILGASGGVGHLAVQLAKRMGARVFAVASGDDGVEFVRRLGADAVVDGHKDDVIAVAHEFAPDGLDAALLVAGGGSGRACADGAARRRACHVSLWRPTRAAAAFGSDDPPELQRHGRPAAHRETQPSDRVRPVRGPHRAYVPVGTSR
jgi:NADPH2:quinone reductase